MFSMWTWLVATISLFCLTFVLIPRCIFNGSKDCAGGGSGNGNDVGDISPNVWRRSTTSSAEAEDLFRRLQRNRSSSTMMAEDDVDVDHLASLRLQFVRLKYPWTNRDRFLPNYITKAPRLRFRNLKTDVKDLYTDSVIVFVHVPRTSGTSLVACLANLEHRNSINSSSSSIAGAAAGPKRGKILTMAPQTTENFRRSSWDNYESGPVQLARNRYDFHAGGSSYGVCDSVRQRSCSYFTILRDPFEQAVSTYRHCRIALGDPRCAVVDANLVSLRDWIVHVHGGDLFRKFLFDSRICDESIETIVENEDNVSKLPLQTSAASHCWYKHKLWVDTFPHDERRILLDYILDNLEDHFAAIGLYEDMDATLRTLEFVYGMPFSECRHQILRGSKIDENNLRPADDDDGRSSNDGGRDLEKEVMESLRQDVDVRKALMFDEAIYRRARDIVSEQNRRLFNRMKS